MIENSSAGLFMLESAVTVTVTHEEHHQQVLARYPVGPGNARTVAVELGWCTITSGKYRGQRAVEVRLDGHRVGELTYAMSQRYGTAVNLVAARGARPGCAAVVHLGQRGIELDLRLPRPGAPVTGLLAPVAPSTRTAAAAPRRGIFARHRPAWVGAAVVIGGLLIAGILNPDTGTPSQNVAANSLATGAITSSTAFVAEPPATTAETTTTTSTTTTSQNPVTTTVARNKAPVTTVVKKKAPPVTHKTAAPPKTKAAPPKSKCDPNYTGCVPIASDVDCAGGSGNGPAYVQGPIRVIGRDIYKLDSDHDGIACEDD